MYLQNGKMIFLMNEIVPCVCGGIRAREAARKSVDNWLTVSDEAFALVCYQNYFDWIKDCIQNPTGTSKHPLWTHKQEKGVRRNQGWMAKGLETFDEYFRDVKKARV